MASNTVMYTGATLAKFQSEMDDINNQDAIQGYRVFITWGALEPTPGQYDFSALDAILARLKTQYNKPKRLVVALWLYGQHSFSPGDTSVIPRYITQSPAYGASPVAGSYGWWGKNSGGASTGMYAPAIYYQPVMDRLIAMVQALAQHYDGEPYFEGLEIQENATVAQAAAQLGSVDPNYSDGNFLKQLERLLTAATTAFPHTSVIMDNTWFVKPAPTVALEQWMATNRVAPGTPDSWGQSSLTTYTTGHLSDGIQTYLGVDPYGGTVDLRPKMRAMIEVQMPDIMGTYFGSKGGPWAPLDIINAANQTYKASHVFWTHLFGTETLYGATVPAAAKWSNLAATCAANPLTNTGYPPNYP